MSLGLGGKSPDIVFADADLGRESGLQHVEEYLNVKAGWIKTG